MKQLRMMGFLSALMGLCSLLVIPVSQGEPVKPSKTIKTEYQYSAKVACSLLLPHQVGTLARGTYRTTVNIHNPSDKKISIAAKVALAAQFGSEPGPFDVSPFKEAVIQPDGAVGINCFDIANYFCPINGVCVDFAFLEGFLVVKSPVPLDVVGVYTARHTDGDVESMDVEAVEGRQVREGLRVLEHRDDSGCNRRASAFVESGHRDARIFATARSGRDRSRVANPYHNDGNRFASHRVAHARQSRIEFCSACDDDRGQRPDLAWCRHLVWGEPQQPGMMFGARRQQRCDVARVGAIVGDRPELEALVRPPADAVEIDVLDDAPGTGELEWARHIQS